MTITTPQTRRTALGYVTGHCSPDVARHTACAGTYGVGSPHPVTCSCRCHVPHEDVARVRVVGLTLDAFAALSAALVQAYGEETTCVGDDGWLILSRPVTS